MGYRVPQNAVLLNCSEAVQIAVGYVLLELMLCPDEKIIPRVYNMDMILPIIIFFQIEQCSERLKRLISWPAFFSHPSQLV